MKSVIRIYLLYLQTVVIIAAGPDATIGTLRGEKLNYKSVAKEI